MSEVFFVRQLPIFALRLSSAFNGLTAEVDMYQVYPIGYRHRTIVIQIVLR